MLYVKSVKRKNVDHVLIYNNKAINKHLVKFYSIVSDSINRKTCERKLKNLSCPHARLKMLSLRARAV